MKICITRTHKDPYSGTFIRNQIAGLSGLADVYSVHTGRFPEKLENGSLLNPLPFWIIQKVIKILTGSRNNFFSHYGFKRFLKNNRIDVVLANYGPSGVYLNPVCAECRIPLIVHFHGYDATYHKIVKNFSSGYKALFLGVYKIIAVSIVMKEKLIALGAPEEKIAVIPYGIDLTKFRPSPDRKPARIVLAVGRFTEKKAPMNTIKAFAEVFRHFPDSILIMVGGKTDLFEECNKLAETLGLKNSVQFPGVLQSEDIVRLMQNSNVFVQHSITPDNGDMEGTPNSILEASACGLPVVSTLHGGIMEAVLHNETGYLVPENDVIGMAAWIIKLLRDPDLARTMGLKGRAHIEANYELTAQIIKLFKVVQEAAQKK